MKTVFNTGEVPHIWASQQQQQGRNQQDNLYFNGNTIYSYGSHFPIAKIIGEYVLFNCCTYSVTTSRHQRNVKQAINHKIVIDVLNPEVISDHKGNLKYFFAEIEKYIKLQNRARIYNYFHEINKLIKDANNYIKLFKLGRNLTKVEKEILTSTAENLCTNNNQINQAIKQRQKKQDTKKRKDAREAKIKALENIELWLNNKIDYLPYNSKNLGIFIRTTEDKKEIQTSENAKITYEKGKELFKLYSLLKAKNENWISNGNTFKLGYYNLDAIIFKPHDHWNYSKPGLHAGCHHITHEEIERFINSQNW